MHGLISLFLEDHGLSKMGDYAQFDSYNSRRDRPVTTDAILSPRNHPGGEDRSDSRAATGRAGLSSAAILAKILFIIVFVMWEKPAFGFVFVAKDNCPSIFKNIRVIDMSIHKKLFGDSFLLLHSGRDVYGEMLFGRHQVAYEDRRMPVRICKPVRNLINNVSPDASVFRRRVPMIPHPYSQAAVFPIVRAIHVNRYISAQLPLGGIVSAFDKLVSGLPQLVGVARQDASDNNQKECEQRSKAGISLDTFLDIPFVLLCLSVIGGFFISLGGYRAFDNQWRFFGSALVVGGWFLSGCGLLFWCLL